ncbi:MAG: hypothetical protein JWO36_4323 [Myxococcales bacterium]|nr:hypothetical protein [Myxococcales bacterium]
MRIVIVIVTVAFAIFGDVAQASPSGSAEPSGTELAVAVNAPFRWPHNVAASMYLGFCPHQAVRANFARYEYEPNPAGEIIGIAADGAVSEGTYRGAITDVGVGWMYFPRRLWSGFSFEAGVLRRARDHSIDDAFVLETKTTTYAGRALIGWSWRIDGRGFISIAGGISVGRESGTEIVTSTGGMSIAHDVTRSALGAEGFLRIGAAFGL